MISFKSYLRKIIRKNLKLEINRYNPSQSNDAKLKLQLESNRIDLVIDIGANDGGYASRLIEMEFRGKILSFEPLLNEWEMISKKSRTQEKWIIAPRMALGEKEYVAEINVSKNRASSSLRKIKSLHVEAEETSQTVSFERVIVQRLDAVSLKEIDAARRIFLKIDTQGYELQVIKGCEGLLERVVGIQLELSLTELYEGQETYKTLMDEMEGLGFVLWAVEPGFFDKRTGRLLQFDAIYFRQH